MGFVKNFYGADLSVLNVQNLKDKSYRGKGETANASVNEKAQVKPEQEQITVSALDIMAIIAKSEIRLGGKKDGELTYEQLVEKYWREYSEMDDSQKVDLLKQIIDKWPESETKPTAELVNWKALLSHGVYNLVEDKSNIFTMEELEDFENHVSMGENIDLYVPQSQNIAIYTALVSIYTRMISITDDPEQLEVLEKKLEAAQSFLNNLQNTVGR